MDAPLTTCCDPGFALGTGGLAVDTGDPHLRLPGVHVPAGPSTPGLLSVAG